MGTLVIAGILLYIFNIVPEVGKLAIFAGIIIAILLGILGVAAVAKRVVR